MQPDEASTLSATALSNELLKQANELSLDASLPLGGTSKLLFPEDKAAFTATRALESSLPAEPSKWQALAEDLYDDSEDEDDRPAEPAQASRFGVGRCSATLKSLLAGTSTLKWSDHAELSELSDFLARSAGAGTLDYSGSGGAPTASGPSSGGGAGTAGAKAAARGDAAEVAGAPARRCVELADVEASAPSPSASACSTTASSGGVSPGVMDKAKLEAFAFAVKGTKGLGSDLQSELLRLLESMPSP